MKRLATACHGFHEGRERGAVVSGPPQRFSRWWFFGFDLGRILRRYIEGKRP
jgi:hypothetical protein